MRLVFWFYQFLTVLFSPLIRLLIQWRKLTGYEDRARYIERYGHATIAHEKYDIWLHAASVGEVISISSLIKTIQKKHPKKKILVTTVTKTGAKVLQPHLNENIAHQYAPFDSMFWVKRFLRNFNPSVFVMVESEIWPNIIYQCKSRRIRTIVINGRISRRTYGRYKLLRSLVCCVAKYLDEIYAQSQTDLDRYHNLGMDQAALKTNMKYAALPLSFKMMELQSLQEMIGSRPIFLCASTHSGEEVICLEAFKRLREKYKDILLIILPRHPHRLNEVKSLCKEGAVAIRSLNHLIDSNINIYIADTVGEAGLFYELANVSFIGGSLVPRGGHNPIEPFLLNCAVISGQYISNFADMYAEFQKAVVFVKDGDELYQAVDKYLQKPILLEQAIQNAQEIIESKANVLDEYTDLICQ